MLIWVPQNIQVTSFSVFLGQSSIFQPMWKSNSAGTQDSDPSVELWVSPLFSFHWEPLQQPYHILVLTMSASHLEAEHTPRSHVPSPEGALHANEMSPTAKALLKRQKSEDSNNYIYIFPIVAQYTKHLVTKKVHILQPPPTTPAQYIRIKKNASWPLTEGNVEITIHPFLLCVLAFKGQTGSKWSRVAAFVVAVMSWGRTR